MYSNEFHLPSVDLSVFLNKFNLKKLILSPVTLYELYLIINTVFYTFSKCWQYKFVSTNISLRGKIFSSFNDKVDNIVFIICQGVTELSIKGSGNFFLVIDLNTQTFMVKVILYYYYCVNKCYTLGIKRLG